MASFSLPRACIYLFIGHAFASKLALQTRSCPLDHAVCVQKVFGRLGMLDATEAISPCYYVECVTSFHALADMLHGLQIQPLLAPGNGGAHNSGHKVTVGLTVSIAESPSAQHRGHDTTPWFRLL